MDYAAFLLKSRGLPLADRLILWEEFNRPLPKVSLKDQYMALPRKGLWNGRRHTEEAKAAQAERMRNYHLNKKPHPKTGL